MHSNFYGKSGVISGFSAFGIALFQFWFGSLDINITSININAVISIGSITLAFLTLIFSAISFLKKENNRFSAVAVCLGSITLAFHFIVVLIVLIIIIAIALYIVSNN